MPLNYHSRHDDQHSATDHLKDSSLKIAVVGYGIPLCILAVVCANVAYQTVVMPAGRWPRGNILGGVLQSYGPGWQFAGAITMKLALAAALFSWYALANYARTERWAQPALLASILLFGAGVVVFATGFVV